MGFDSPFTEIPGRFQVCIQECNNTGKIFREVFKAEWK